MIYALIGAEVPVADREAIAQAVRDRNAVVLARYASQGTIRHILDVARTADEVLELDDLLEEPKREAFHCIWCLDTVHGSRHRGPRGYTVQAVWHFVHSTNADCIGHSHRIGGGVYLNPEHHGCYVAMGCERAPERHRTQCQTIAGGRTYCHHATAPPDGRGPCLPSGR